jgi:hypothetical protein
MLLPIGKYILIVALQDPVGQPVGNQFHRAIFIHRAVIHLFDHLPGDLPLAVVMETAVDAGNRFYVTGNHHQVMTNQHDRNTFIELLEHLVKFVLPSGVDAGGGFVQEKKLAASPGPERRILSGAARPKARQCVDRNKGPYPAAPGPCALQSCPGAKAGTSPCPV